MIYLWESFVRHLEKSLFNRKILEAIYKTCTKNKSLVLADLTESLSENLKLDCIELMIRMGNKELVKFVKNNFLNNISFERKDKIVHFAMQKFKQLHKFKENYSFSTIDEITPFTNPIFMCLFDYPRTFVKIIENFHNLPDIVTEYITSKFDIILNQSVFYILNETDRDMVGHYFKELYSRYKDSEKNPKYAKLIRIFYDHLVEKSHSIKDSVLNHLKDLFLTYKDVTIFDKLTYILSVNKVVEFQIQVCYDHEFDNISQVKILKLNNISYQKFIIELIFNENNDNKKLQCLYKFQNIVLSAKSLVSNSYAVFYKKEFIAEILEKLRQIDPYNKDQNNGTILWKPNLFLSFIKKICSCKKSDSIKTSYTNQIKQFKDQINEIISKKFYKDEKILKQLVQLSWVEDFSQEGIKKSRKNFILEINELLQEIIPGDYKKKFKEQISIDKHY